MPGERPECDKMVKVKAQSQAIGEFLEWLGANGIVLAEYHKHDDGCREGGPLRYNCGYYVDELRPRHEGTQAILARHFNIDMKKVEA